MTQTPRVRLATCSSRPTARQVRGGRGGHQAARAVAEQVRAIAARDVQHGIERLDHRVGVRVQAPVALLRARVAPGDREHLLAALDQVLDVASSRREIHDVELVDHRRHEEDRDLPHLRGRRLVVDELEPLVAEHDGSRAQGEVAADGELADVDVGGQAGRLPHVVGELARAAHEAPPARVDRSLEHRGIDERSVGGRQRVDDVLGDEVQLAVIGPVELGIVDEPAHRVVHGEVGLQQPVVDPALRPGGVDEPAVAARRLQLRAAGDDLRELPGQRGAAPDHPPGMAGEPRHEAEGLPAWQEALTSAESGLREQQVERRAGGRVRVLILVEGVTARLARLRCRVGHDLSFADRSSARTTNRPP